MADCDKTHNEYPRDQPKDIMITLQDRQGKAIGKGGYNLVAVPRKGEFIRILGASTWYRIAKVSWVIVPRKKGQTADDLAAVVLVDKLEADPS